MKNVIASILVLALYLMFGMAQYTLADEGRLVYTGETDPEQVNGNVDGGGHISTDGDSVKIEGPWSVISTAPMTAAHMPANQPFEAAWKYIAWVENITEEAIPENGGSGLTIKYYDAEGGNRIDEYRMIVGNKEGNLEVFWCNWGSGYGVASWTDAHPPWNQWGGCNFTSVPVPIPDSRYFKVAYDGTKYEVFYSITGDGWIHIPEMTLPKDSLINKAITVDDPNAVREFQFPSRNGVQVNLDWLVIKGEGFPDFNADVAIGIEDLGGGRLVYSGESDLEQVNGNVHGGGHISTSGDTVKIKGAWSVISTAPMTSARMYANEGFEAAWKYVSSAELPEGGGSGLTIKYYSAYDNDVRIDEYRMLVGNNAGDLEVFWANWGAGYGVASWTANPDWADWGGANVTSDPVDVPDDAVYFRVTYDGNNYKVFYSVVGDLWTPLPGMTFHKDNLINKDITVDDPDAGREFQLPSKGGAEVNLDWLVIKGKTFPAFNPNVEIGVEDLGGVKEEPRLYAHYPLDDDGNIAMDVVGGNHGVLYNYTEGEDKWIEGAPDGLNPDSGLYFDGIDDVVVISNMLNEGSITIAFWAQPQDISQAWKGYVAYDRVYESAWGGPWIGQGGSTGQIQFAVVFQDTSTGDTREQMFVSTESYWEDFTWGHVACTWSEETKTRTIYFNGELAEENQPNTTTAPENFIRISGGNQILFGMWNYQGLGGSPLGQANVILDDIRFYNYALTEDEVADLYKGTMEVKAYLPKPADGAVNVPRDKVLSWYPGMYAVSHDVYFGTDFDDVNDANNAPGAWAEFKGNQESCTYTPVLELDKTYYWRVDEVNDTEPNSPWKGNVWSFTVANYIVVENFEDYTDYEPYTVWNTWADGYDDPTNGSSAGYPDPDFFGGEHYLETRIVHSGNWSMPLCYDNSAGISEITRTLNADWTQEDVVTLTMWYHGVPDNAIEPMYVALDGNAVVTNDDANAALVTKWTRWDIPLQAFANLGVNLVNVNTMSIGFGNRANPVPGGSGHVFFDDIRLYRPD